MLQQHQSWTVCGEAASGQDALNQLQQMTPDIIVLDFLMPGMNGLQTAQAINKVAPAVPILMLTMHLSHQLIEEARNVGIRGAVGKCDAGRVVEGLEALLRNEHYFSLVN